MGVWSLYYLGIHYLKTKSPLTIHYFIVQIIQYNQKRKNDKIRGADNKNRDYYSY